MDYHCWSPDKEEIGHGVFANFEGAILAVFFTLAGMDLHFQYAVTAGAIAIDCEHDLGLGIG